MKIQLKKLVMYIRLFSLFTSIVVIVTVFLYINSNKRRSISMTKQHVKIELLSEWISSEKHDSEIFYTD